MPHDIFISHANKDSEVAEAISARLESRGIRCWMAPRDVRAGYPYPGEIARAITGSKVMILILSKAANVSDHVMREVGLAADCRLHIVQFCIEDVKPSDDLSYYLSLPHRVDALCDPLSRHLDSLEKAVDGLLETWRLNHGSVCDTSQGEHTVSDPPEETAAKNRQQEDQGKASEAAARNTAGRKKLVGITAILAFAAIVSAFFLIGDDEPEPVANKLPIVEAIPVEPEGTPEPGVEKKLEKRSTITVSFRKEISVGDDGCDYSTFEIHEGISRARKKESGADGNLIFDSLEPGAILEITLIGDIGSKKSVGLASRKIKLPDKAPAEPINVILPARLPVIVISNPHEILDYREVSVTFPETKTQPADLTTGGTNTLSIEDFEPKSALFVSGRELPAKGENASFPVAGSGEWTINYEGGVLEPTTETVSVHGETLRYPKSLPEPFSGKYSIVVPMTRFPSETERNEITKTGNPSDSKPFKIPYYNEMVYGPDNAHMPVRKSLREILSGQELPHYIGLILDLGLYKGGISHRSKVQMIRIYPHMEVVYLECEVNEVTRISDNSIRLDVFSLKGYQGGYSLPGTDKWAEEFLKLTNKGSNKGIHPFVRKSMDEWVAWFSRPENERDNESASSMKFADWIFTDIRESFSVILTRGQEGIHLTEVSQVMDKENLYHGRADEAELPDRIHAVFYETVTTGAESKLKPIRTGEE